MNTFKERSTTGRYALHRLPSPKLDPWIFYSHGKRNRAHTFYSMSERRIHNKCIKEMVDTDILCSLHGWLVLLNQNDRRSCQLFNPVSMETIELPLLSRPCYDFCALSCDPINPDCIVMLIKAEEGTATCCFCRPGDVVWFEKDLVLEKDEYCSDYVRAVGCYKGQICIFTFFEKIFILGADPPYLTLTDLGVQLIPIDPGHNGRFEDFLVESDGELFVIRKLELRIDAYDLLVCKLDISEKKKGLVAVENLGGRAFFLSSFTSGISCFAENRGIKANTIYFTEFSDPRIYSFDLQKKVLTFSLPCPNVKRNLVQAEWILPLSPTPCKLDCRVDIIAPLQIQKSMMDEAPINRSIGKDWSRLPEGITNSVAEKLSSRFIVRDWSELPNDMLISIAEKLSCVSCARAATVCRSWGSVITWAPKKLLGCPTFLHMPYSENEVFHFMSNGRHSVPVPENPVDLSIQHAKYGWLLMSRGGKEIFFLNPLTSEKIEIPDLPHALIRGLCFTSLPTSSECSVLGIDKSRPKSFVYHIRRGETEWTEVEIPKFPEADVGDFEFIPYGNPVFHNDVFYWMWSCGNLGAFDPRKGEGGVEFLREPQRPCEFARISYLFESGEKLMSVFAGKHGKWVRVYQLDETSMAWKEVNTLDNKAVFLSRNCSLVTDSREMPGFEDVIYFNRFAGDNKPLFYSLKTGKLEVYGGGDHTAIRDFCDIPEYQIRSAWIKPNVKQYLAQELSWYS